MSNKPDSHEATLRGEAPPEPSQASGPPPLPARSAGFRAGFWRTVFFVLARVGRFPEEIRPRVERRPAKYFRSLVVSCALAGLVSSSLLRVGTLREGAEASVIVLPVAILAWWLVLRCLIGVTRWFVAPASLSETDRETAVGWSEYLTAPMALLVLLCPLPAVLLLQDPSLSLLVARFSGVAIIGVFVLWYVAVVYSLPSVAGLTRRRATASAIGILLTWATVLAAASLLPASVVMWVLLYGSLG